MKNNKFTALLVAAIAAIFLISSCDLGPGIKSPGRIGDSGEISLGDSGQMKKFNSKEELVDFLEKSQQYSNIYGSYNPFIRAGAAAESMVMRDAAITVQAGAKTASSAGGDGGASEYSSTNIQVEGVDEADFVKNDGKYIYLISGNMLVIVDAFPAEDAEILSETEIEGYARELFIKGDMLVIFSEKGEETDTFMEYDFLPRPVYKQKTHALIYDISDRENPRLVEDFDLKGNYLTSRMIDGIVYLIAQDYVYYYGGYIDMPVVRGMENKIVSPGIFYFDMPDSNYNFNTVVSFDLAKGELISAQTFMMGYSNTIYVSEDNIYIASQKSLPYRLYQEDSEKRFFEIVVPLLPQEARAEINSIKADSSLNSFERWDKISTSLEKMYNSMEKKEKERLIEEIEDAIAEYEIKREEEMRKTVIHKINIDGGSLEYGGMGEVKGYLLNQFSMDEHDGNLRVATTFETWTQKGSILYNNIYVLDSEMRAIGELEEIAPDERIYSARFIGDRLYMVTFMRIDPFFVIDLSNPRSPEVLGELKIPGYSDYLHPYDENHIIGIGKETKENEWGGISTKGVKLALFDVSDVSDPKAIARYEIGEAGTDSEALHEHKAFLFDKEKNLLAIPIREVRGKEYYDSRYGYYRQRVWQGAYVFGLTAKNGFELKGKISHAEGEEDRYAYYGSPSAVRRALFMDEVLYTVSMKKIMMNSLDDIDDEIGEVSLPYKEQSYPYPMYKEEIMVG